MIAILTIFSTLCLFQLNISLSDSSYPTLAPNIKYLENELPTNGRKRPLLPKLLPHRDESYILEFHNDNCEYCDQMEPVLQRLEDDLGTKVRRIHAGLRQDVSTLLETIGFDEYGSFPFYYNRRTGQAIGGPTAYLNLKRLGTADHKLVFSDNPQNMHDREKSPSKKHEIGAKGMLLNTLNHSSKKNKKQGDKKGGDEKVVRARDQWEQLPAQKRTERRKAAREAKRAAFSKK